MHLQHLHLRNPIPYIHSLRLQESVLEKHFNHKSLLRNNASLNIDHTAIPQPTLLTFQTLPTYTVGRRHLTANPLSLAQISFLTAASNAFATTANEETHDTGADTRPQLGDLATFFPTPRGGLLTYHAPGQLTAYLILNLRSHNLTPRCYIRLLENTVIRTCARHGVPNVVTTEDPGVWIAEKSTESIQEQATSQSTESCAAGSANVDQNLTPTDRKICAIGIHVSRGITSHGIGLNVFDSPIDVHSMQRALYTLPRGNIYAAENDPNEAGMLGDSTIPAPGYLSWGFSRIVACGLEGKSVTWLDREKESHKDGTNSSEKEGTHVQPDEVAKSLALEVARSLKLEDNAIQSISEKDVLGN